MNAIPAHAYATMQVVHASISVILYRPIELRSEERTRPHSFYLFFIFDIETQFFIEVLEFSSSFTCYEKKADAYTTLNFPLEITKEKIKIKSLAYKQQALDSRVFNPHLFHRGQYRRILSCSTPRSTHTIEEASFLHRKLIYFTFNLRAAHESQK